MTAAVVCLTIVACFAVIMFFWNDQMHERRLQQERHRHAQREHELTNALLLMQVPQAKTYLTEPAPEFDRPPPRTVMPSAMPMPEVSHDA